MMCQRDGMYTGVPFFKLKTCKSISKGGDFTLKQACTTKNNIVIDQGCPTGGLRHNILWHSVNAWPPNLVCKRLFSERKKFFKLKLCENSHDVMVAGDITGYGERGIDFFVLRPSHLTIFLDRCPEK